VANLRKVPLWFSPVYPGVKPTAEYHPNAGWLRDNGRDPAMAKGVEFTDVKDFEAETKRMPNFTLHELAHGYHDRVLKGGFGNAEIKAAYERAKASGSYDKVERWFGNGRPNKEEKAYAMTNPMEYFAETTEAFFSRNDYFPFTREELKRHDPEMEKLLKRVWGASGAQASAGEVKSPPAELKLPAFYTKYLDADGYDAGLVALCREVFGDTELKCTTPATRQLDHLAGYETATSRKFTWPERLTQVRAEIQQKAQARGDAGNKSTTAAPKEPGK
jgi:hypothetical protein